MIQEELKRKKISELFDLAEKLNVPDYRDRNKQGRVLASMEADARQHNIGAEGIEVTGVLEILEEGFGFLRSPDYSYLPSSDDVYVSPSQIKRFALRTGDTIVGHARPPKNSERYFALLKIDTENGTPLEEDRRRVPFDALTALYPLQRIQLETPEKSDFSMRVEDLFVPIGKGQRGLIVSPPRAGKTILLQKIANCITANHPEIKLNHRGRHGD